ncbi:hypothetical protein GCM10010470_09730 [Saccharopolyspora taberi]|uniref:Uncharacterized protein n=1 Tax=Saccharopolyspora taberi TaxID=60895 RepID=A0ABN3V535_9PSEU
MGEGVGGFGGWGPEWVGRSAAVCGWFPGLSPTPDPRQVSGMSLRGSLRFGWGGSHPVDLHKGYQTASRGPFCLGAAVLLCVPP